MNLTIGAWNYVAPKAESIVRPALDFIGNTIAKGFNFVTSAFDMGLDDLVIGNIDDDEYEYEEDDDEYWEVLDMINNSV